jgi:hypothetical protein
MAAPARPTTARATEVGDEQGSGVGHVGRVVLAGLARTRMKEAHDGLGRGYDLRAEMGTGARFFFLNLNRVLSSKINGFKYF